MADYPQYVISVMLDNGQAFTASFGPLPGLPQALEDALAATAARAIRDFDWAAATASVTPPATSAQVTLVRQFAASADVALGP